MEPLSLPIEFITRIREQLGPEAEAFLASYAEARTQGLRCNPLKAAPDDAVWKNLRQLFQLEAVPWCPTGFYYPEEARPGRHPYHAAGLYYIQEPSAMASAEQLAPEPGETVLDLAGAPGGKSTQIAGMLQGRGLLVANEIHPGRARILSENIERMGISNAIVTSMTPDSLAVRFPFFFDRIMLDAPCSGEGMFRKDPDAAEEWNAGSPAFCAARQKDILKDAVKMLKPGGILGYSTCTFNREENEEVIQWLLAEYPLFRLLASERIWPHKERGEGHFVAFLQLGAKPDETIGAGEARGGLAKNRAKG
ncbi:RsmB/NOP family class I SAM-dependent RNA methyltransferase, partial [Gorillibacterium massiliense]|uniref:RsmB/NOP family class I SAM-dependent RNA methyltransferase n=1 Tax=Gorillibacterium massiliense TaxID=1280390 RepID=UPI00138E0F15